MLLIHGRQDPPIPVSQSEEMQVAAHGGRRVNDLLLVNGGHALDFKRTIQIWYPTCLNFSSANLWKETLISPIFLKYTQS